MCDKRPAPSSTLTAPRGPLRTQAPQEARRLIVFPRWGWNPYQGILELALSPIEWELRATDTTASFLSEVKHASGGDIVHVHWTTPIVQQAPSRRRARARVRAIDGALAAAKSRGAHVVWTVHNRLPHELRFDAEERQLLSALHRHADAVHVMSPSTRTLLADVIDLDPSKMVTLPHPSYVGCYPSPRPRSVERNARGLDDRDFAILFLGQIRPYKGLSDLVAATENIAAVGRRPVLMIVGAATHEDQRTIERLTAHLPEVLVRIGHASDEGISGWFASADVAVFPYRRILNSGSLHLAATFGVPAVLPRLEHLVDEYGDETWIRFFDPSDSVDDLTETLRSRVPPRAEIAASASAFAERRSPWRTSLGYLELLRSLR